jgi:4-hydroxy-3-methylbut-2-enyl diphosphate reductase
MVETLYLAKPRGFCAGVVMAIEAVEDAARTSAQRGRGSGLPRHRPQRHRVGRLEAAHGVHFVEDLAALEPLRAQARATGKPPAETVVFSAHGVSPGGAAGRAGARFGDHRRDLSAGDQSPFRGKKYAREGFHILLIGDSSRHQEVIGTKGEAPEATTVVSVVGNRKHDPALADPGACRCPTPTRWWF